MIWRSRWAGSMLELLMSTIGLMVIQDARSAWLNSLNLFYTFLSVLVS